MLLQPDSVSMERCISTLRTEVWVRDVSLCLESGDKRLSGDGAPAEFPPQFEEEQSTFVFVPE